MEKIEFSNGACETFSDHVSHGVESSLVTDGLMTVSTEMPSRPTEDVNVTEVPVTECRVENSGDLGSTDSTESPKVCGASATEIPDGPDSRAASVREVHQNKRSIASDEVSRALIQRKQPLMELVSSEEGYVRRLKMVKERYMPIVSTARTPATPLANEAALLSSTVFSSSGTISSGSGSASQPPTVPDDLAARWRIVWGNWIQLCEWHSAFLEKLTCLADTDPDRIPKLFIDSRARLRSIYSKYCENHRKAALIAEQYRDYFEELRIYLCDKEDVVSYLMQPVQRIMRYQLPMTEIVKYTQRACIPELHLWTKALDIMKEIPKDTQLILEAARIDGFPGVITALGNILIRGDLLVATATRDQLLETVTAYKLALQESTNSMGLPDSVHAVVRSTFGVPVAQPGNHRSLTAPVSPIAASQANTVEIQTANSQGVSTTGGSTGGPVVPPSDAGVTVESNASELFVGNLKFTESRLFLFEQMLVVTEEAKLKRRVTSLDTFSQSTYQFRAAINVNKMRYESHWYNCSLPNGHTNADAAALDQFLSTGLAPDDLRFAVLDQTPGRDVVYVIDPITSANREAWVVQLRDIQRMQHEFLLALQDPRRFKTGARDESWSGTRLSTDTTAHTPNRPESPTPIVCTDSSQLGTQSQIRQRKWPSFTMNRPRRLGSSSSSSSTAVTTTTASSSTTTVTKSGFSRPQLSSTAGPEPLLCADRSTGAGSLSRSLSAERRPFLRASSSTRSSSKLCPGSGQETGDDPDAPPFRKSSLSANSSLKITNQIGLVVDSAGNISPDTSTGVSKVGAGKKRNVFASLFGRNKSKQRANRQAALQPLSTGPSLPSSVAEHADTAEDHSHPPRPPVLSATSSSHSPRPESASAIQLSSFGDIQ